MRKEINKGCLEAQEFIEKRAKESKAKMEDVFASALVDIESSLKNAPPEQVRALYCTLVLPPLSLSINSHTESAIQASYSGWSGARSKDARRCRGKR
jgi:hypothetical protein